MNIITANEARKLAQAAPTDLSKEIDGCARNISSSSKWGSLYTTCTADKQFYESVKTALEEKGYRVEPCLNFEITSAPQRILFIVNWDNPNEQL